MSKITLAQNQNSTFEETLKKLARRVEEIAIDTHETRNELRMVKLRLGNVEHNTEMMKVDMENLRKEMEEMKVEIKEIGRNIDSLILVNGEILKKAVTQEEFQDLSHRVATLESQ